MRWSEPVSRRLIGWFERKEIREFHHRIVAPERVLNGAVVSPSFGTNDIGTVYLRPPPPSLAL